MIFEVNYTLIKLQLYFLKVFPSWYLEGFYFDSRWKLIDTQLYLVLKSCFTLWSILAERKRNGKWEVKDLLIQACTVSSFFFFIFHSISRGNPLAAHSKLTLSPLNDFCSTLCKFCLAFFPGFGSQVATEKISRKKISFNF